MSKIEAEAIKARLRDEPDLVLADPALMSELGLRVDAANIVDFGPAALAKVKKAGERDAAARKAIAKDPRISVPAKKTELFVLREVPVSALTGPVFPPIRQLARKGEVLAAITYVNSVTWVNQHFNMIHKVGENAGLLNGQGLVVALVLMVLFTAMNLGGAKFLSESNAIVVVWKTAVPVLGVPVPGKHLQGVDSLYSIVQMPKGIPVATFAIGTAGAANAALFAVAMLATDSPELRGQLEAYRERQRLAAVAMTEQLA